LRQAFDLPGRAESKGSVTLLDRRGLPSSKEGKTPGSNSFTRGPWLNSFTASAAEAAEAYATRI